jgi:hypothetical protein
MVSTATTPSKPRSRAVSPKRPRKRRARAVRFSAGHLSGPLGAFRGVPAQASGWAARFERGVGYLPY